jgi:hypothetical protein
MTNLLPLYELTCFEGETPPDDGGAAAAAAAAVAAAEAAAAKLNPSDEDKKFTQDEVNQFVGTRNKALKEQFEVMETRYTEMLETANLSDGIREKLQNDLAAVQSQMRTEKQQLEFDKKKAETKYATEIADAVQQRDDYKQLFESSTVNRAIQDGSIQHGGHRVDDFIAHLGGRSSVVDEVDADGKPTGRKVPRTEWSKTDVETGQVEKVHLDPAEVISLMKEDPTGQWGHLFMSESTPGVGSGNTPTPSSTAKVNVKKLTSQQYMALRKTPEGRAKLGLN